MLTVDKAISRFRKAAVDLEKVAEQQRLSAERAENEAREARKESERATRILGKLHEIIE